MSVFDDPRGKLRWLEEELMDGESEEEYEEPEEESPPRKRRKHRPSKAIFADEREIDEEDAVLVKKKKRKVKGLGRLKFLAFLEMLGILAVVWWWIKCLY